MPTELERIHLWTERWIALTAVAWLCFLAVTDWPDPRRTAVIWSLEHTAVASIAALGVCLCGLLPRRADFDRFAVAMPAFAAAALFCTALETCIVGFHAPCPPTWEVALLIAAAGLVAIVGGALRRRPRRERLASEGCRRSNAPKPCVRLATAARRLLPLAGADEHG